MLSPIWLSLVGELKRHTMDVMPVLMITTREA
jgi:hypothetical protein